jgi:KDO2-lipid IV(A) lauroyltransferase
VAIVRLLPMRGVLAAGAALGRAFYVFDAGHRRLAIENLQHAFPLRSREECRQIARRMFEHFGRLLMVLLKFSTMTPQQMLALVEFDGEERVRAAHARGRGVLLFTGHFGFWEINALVHALQIEPISVLARPLDNPLLHDLLERVRRSTGNHVIYRRGAIRRVLRALASNQAVAVVCVQHRESAAAGLLQSPGSDDLGAGCACHQDRRRHPAGLRPADPGRTVPHGLRTSRRTAARQR